MNIRTYDQFEHPDIDPAAWNALLDQSGTNKIFLTHEWLSSWWESYNSGSRLMIIVAKKDGKWAGIAPMCISKENGHEVMRFVADRNSDYCDLIISRDFPEVKHEILEILAGFAGEWDVIHLRNLPESSDTFSLLEVACGKFNRYPKITSISPCFALGTNGGSSTALKITRKKTLRRRFNFLEKNGSLVHKRITNTGELSSYLPKFFSQHIERWRTTGSPSLFNDERARKFYGDVGARLLGTGQLMFTVLEFNGTPIAFHFGFEYNSQITWYKPSYDLAFSRRSPGKVLLKYLIEYCVEEDVNVLDFTIGDETYKHDLSNIRSRNLTVEVHKTTAGRYLSSLQRGVRRLLKKMLRWKR